MTQKTIGTATPKKALGARKADANPSIEGTWTFTMGDWYNGDDSLGSIEIDFNATLDDDGLWFEDPTNYELPFVADYDSSTGTLTFTTAILGNTGTYNVVQRPFVYSGGLNFTNITATYNASAGTITFDADNGIAWAAWSSNNASSQVGYYSIYDLEGAEKAVPWTLMEDATFNENILYALFKGEQNTVTNAAEVYENPFTPGIYRLMNPFKTLYAALNFNGVSPTMLIDATDPNNVKVGLQNSGISGNTTVGAYYYFNEGWYCETYDEELDTSLACTVTTDSEGYTVITFPYNSFTVMTSVSSQFYYAAAYPSVLRFKAPKSETPAPSLSFEDVEMEVEAYSTQAVTTTVDIQLNADPAFLYQGFQFDVTLPEGVEVTEAISSTVATTIKTQPVPTLDNTYRVLGYLNSNEGTNATGTIATLTLSTKWDANADYDIEGTMAIVAPIVFSSVTGDDISNIEGYEGNITITLKETPVTDINIEDVTLMAPSSTMAGGDVDNVTAGESLHIDLTLSPEGASASTTDITWTASPDVDGIEFEYDNEGNLIVNMEDVSVEQPTEVTITGTVGGVSAEYSFTINPVKLGDSNDSDIVNVADVVTTANYMNEKDVARFDYPNANVILTEVEGAQVINQADVTATIDIAFGKTDIDRNPQSLKRMVGVFNNNDLLVADDFNVVYGAQTTIGISLNNSVDYVGLHAEVILPEGMKAVAVTKGQRAEAHELDYNIKDGKVYVTLYSLRNAGFAQGEGSLFNLVVIADENCGNLSFENINASDAGCNAYYFGFDGGRNLTGTTGIDAINADEDGARYFDLRGVEIPRPEKGIYIRINKNGEAVKVVK